MINYIKSEFYRILSKKSLYIYLGVCMCLYILMTIFRLKYLTQDSIVGEANFVFTFVAIMGGGFLFATIYNDDLNAKTLIPLIGFGEKRTSIVISKIIITIILLSILFLGALIIFYLIFTLLSFKVETNILKELYYNLFLSLGYSIVASILVYGTGKATVSIVVYVLLATGFISQILSLLLSSKVVINLCGNLTKYTIYPIVTNLMDKFTFQNLIPYIIYLIVFTAFSVLAFKKKELEF